MSRAGRGTAAGCCGGWNGLPWSAIAQLVHLQPNMIIASRAPSVRPYKCQRGAGPAASNIPPSAAPAAAGLAALPEQSPAKQPTDSQGSHDDDWPPGGGSGSGGGSSGGGGTQAISGGRGGAVSGNGVGSAGSSGNGDGGGGSAAMSMQQDAERNDRAQRHRLMFEASACAAAQLQLLVSLCTMKACLPCFMVVQRFFALLWLLSTSNCDVCWCVTKSRSQSYGTAIAFDVGRVCACRDVPCI